MSKEEQARVRDELLQGLYRSVLRCELARARAGDSSGSGSALDALAAGVCANLKPGDLLLLPARGAESFRVGRGIATAAPGSPREREAGVFTCPRDGASAIGFTLGLAAALEKNCPRSLVAVLLPSQALKQSTAPAHGKHTRANEKQKKWPVDKLPADWNAALPYAAECRLPILFLSAHGAWPRRFSEPATEGGPGPAPLYPSIPVDGEDPLAAYRVAFECAARVRLPGGGPSHIAAVPFRLRRQTENPNASPDASPDARARLEEALRKRGAFSKAWRQQLERTLVAELSA